MLQRSELEYADCFYVQDASTGKNIQRANISEDLTRKLNLLTLKYRPQCAFNECFVGFRWFTNGRYALSETAFHNGNYPKDAAKSSFKEETLPESVWTLLQKDLSEENQLQAQSRPSTLPLDQQIKLISLVAEYGCEQWRPIGEAMGMKNRREALIEFLRLKIGKDNKSSHI